MMMKTRYLTIRKLMKSGWFAAAGIIVMALFLFLDLAGDVWLNEGLAWDAPLILALHRLSRPWLDILFIGITNTAGAWVSAPLVGTAVYLWRRRERYTAVLMIASFAGAVALNSLFKAVFARPRPELFPPLVVEHSFSFPSGHTMAAIAFYGLMALLLWERGRRLLSMMTAVWVLLVALSRVYLGVHYPSDVLASLAVGTIWLVVMLLLYNRPFKALHFRQAFLAESLNLIYASVQTLILVVRRCWHEIIWGLLTVTALGLALASLGGFWNIQSTSIRVWRWVFWATELSSNFHPQYLAILSLLSFAFLVGGKTKLALLAGAMALMNLALLLPLYATPPPPVDSHSYRALMLNAGHLNDSDTAAFDLIRSTEPDIVVLLEVGKSSQVAFQALHSIYPYTTYRPGQEIYDGSLLYSKFPFAVEDAGQGISQTQSSLVTRVKLGSQTLTLIGTQTHAPTRPGETRDRRLQLEQLGQFIARQSGPILLLGDMNTTPWSPIFHDLLRKSGLHDARNGFGLQPSWPTFTPSFLALPIDQVLVSAGIEVHNFTREPDVGSDHYPISVSFSLSVDGADQARQQNLRPFILLSHPLFSPPAQD